MFVCEKCLKMPFGTLSLNSLFSIMVEIAFDRCRQNVKRISNDLQVLGKFDPLIFDQDSLANAVF